eukprot:tig00000310_g23986.t1
MKSEEGTEAPTESNPTTEAEMQDGQEQFMDEATDYYAGDAGYPLEYSIKHPLQHRWTMWYDNPGKRVNQTNWEDNLRRILTFDTVEDFWCMFNNIVPPSKLAAGSNYHLFKEDVEPKWEDPNNGQGGKWTLIWPTKRRADLDQLWLDLVLSLIGEQFDDESQGQVNGAVVSIRKGQDKLAIWTRGCAENVVPIGQQFKGLANLPADHVIGFTSHEDSMKRNSSYAHGGWNMYEV